MVDTQNLYRGKAGRENAMLRYSLLHIVSQFVLILLLIMQLTCAKEEMAGLINEKEYDAMNHWAGLYELNHG